ncbi:MAG: hypothetical protein AB1796_13885 [Bacillota bacterium]
MAKGRLIKTKRLEKGMVLNEDLKIIATGEVLFPAGIYINTKIIEILHFFPVEKRCRILMRNIPYLCPFFLSCRACKPGLICISVKIQQREHFFFPAVLHRLCIFGEPFRRGGVTALQLPCRIAVNGRARERPAIALLPPAGRSKTALLPFSKYDLICAPPARERRIRKWSLHLLLLTALLAVTGLFAAHYVPFALKGPPPADSIAQQLLPADKQQDGSYTGGEKAGIPHGYGTIVWPDGTVYQGEWHEGQMEGEGEIRWPSGSRYVGRWQEGMMHGPGTIYLPGGAAISGNWQYGRLQHD